MSLLIKDMDMPKSCWKCRLKILTPGGRWACRQLTPKPRLVELYQASRHPDCPLVEVLSPHGDLIDADAIMDLLEKSVPEKNRGLQFYVFRHMLRNAPTVIEAEG